MNGHTIEIEVRDPVTQPCPVHGREAGQFYIRTPGGIEGRWCLRCIMDMLDRLGVQRVIMTDEQYQRAGAGRSDATDPREAG